MHRHHNYFQKNYLGNSFFSSLVCVRARLSLWDVVLFIVELALSKFRILIAGPGRIRNITWMRNNRLQSFTEMPCMWIELALDAVCSNNEN